MAIVTIYKVGTQSSGFYDHAGRPGLVGGSRSPSGRPTDMSDEAVARRARAAAKERERWAALNQQWADISEMSWTIEARPDVDAAGRLKIAKKILSDATDGKFKGHPMELFNKAYKLEADVTDVNGNKFPAKTEVTTVVIHGGRIVVGGYVTIPKAGGGTKTIGSFQRIIRADGEIHHDLFTLNDEYQGSGFGSQFYRQSELVYKKTGFQKITIRANLTVGGYAWARMGFDYDSDYERKDNQNWFEAKWKDESDLPLPPMRHAWDIAAADNGKRYPVNVNGVHKEVTIGALFMLGKGWDAVKYLNDQDPTWQTGQIYYNTKKSKKKKSIELKVGTQSSGFYDHEGRPGLVGGSRSPTGRPTDMSEAAVARRAELAAKERQRVYMRNVRWSEVVLEPTGGMIPANMPGGPDWRERYVEIKTKQVRELLSEATDGQLKEHPMEFLQRAYEYEDKTTGLKSNIVRVSMLQVGTGKPYAMQVNGHVTKDGAKVGTFTRVIYPSGEVHHDYFDISEAFQSTGFGSDFYRKSEAAYKKAGLKKVTLFANLTVGGYAWARMGFDFDPDEGSQQGIKDIFVSTWSASTDLPVPKHDHPWEMAAADNGNRYTKSPTGRELTFGQNYLLGNNWYGVKYLSDTSQTWQIGQMYYKSKKKHKKEEEVLE